MNETLPATDDLRAEVAAFLAEHGQGVDAPVDAANLTLEQFNRNRAFHRALGERGWYAPRWPAEYGGGGLSRSVALEIQRELAAQKRNIRNIASPGDIIQTAAQAVWALGTDWQKRELLPKMLRGETLVWELYTEPEAGSDLPSLKTRAVLDGEDYVISGTKTLVGGHFSCDYFLCLAVTDPEAPRQQNLSAFLIPADLPGITITDLNMIAGSKKRTITLDEVRVPAAMRVCPEGLGWAVFTGERAPRSLGPVGLGNGTVNDLNTVRDILAAWKAQRGQASGQAAVSQRRRATELWVDTEVQRLLRRKLKLMAGDRLPVTYEVAQVAQNAKEFRLRVGEAIQDLFGPAASVSEGPLALNDGRFEYYQRYAILSTHPGGTVEVQKLRMFRGMQAKHKNASKGG